MPRQLTHDERRAAEAAFRGLPPDPQWSSAAWSVYQGLISTLPAAAAPLLKQLSKNATGAEVNWPELPDDIPASSAMTAQVSPKARGETVQFGSRDEAIRAGYLVDVTPQAYDLGLPLPVGLTNAAWAFGITASDTMAEGEQGGRVRDLLMALRLHLSRSPLIPPYSQFPVLLTFPPDPVPQAFTLCAVVHTEPHNHHSLMLFMPSEVSR